MLHTAQKEKSSITIVKVAGEKRYRGLPEKLKKTATSMVVLKLAPAVRKSNSDKIERFERKKRERDKLVMEEGRAKIIDLMIYRLI